MPDSLIRSSLRAFLIAFFAVFGIFLCFTLMMGVFSSLSQKNEEITTSYTPEIQANADGVRKKQKDSSPVILELDIKGVIGTAELNQSKIETLLVESREDTLKDNRVKGILLHINSPGGTITDADGIFRALKAYKAHYNVPIYAFADGLCASGGMYVACAADKVYASDVTLAGSIGVISGSYVNVSQLMEKLGVTALTLSEGKGKDELNPLRPWGPDEDKNTKEIIQHYYLSFVDLIVANRKNVSRDALIKEYGARVFPAETAAKIGFIDEAGMSRNAVLKKLLEALSIDDDFYQVISLKNSNWFSQLFDTKSPAITGKIKHELHIEGDLPKELLSKPLYLYRQ